METLLVIISVIFVLLAVAIGTPLFAIIGGLALYFFTSINTSTSAIVVEMCRVVNMPGIIMIPLFTFSGYLLAESKMSDRLVKTSGAFLSWLPGGLAVVVLVASAFFTSLTGANALAIIAIGGLLLPMLGKVGFDERFSLGLVTASGSLGVLFIPSLPIIIYALIAQVDTVQLFIAGIVPGTLMIVLLAVYAVRHGVKLKMKPERPSIKKMIEALIEIKWEIPLPIIIVGGIFGGIITVGEAAAVTAAYVIIVECFITKDVSIKKLGGVIFDSMVMVGALMCIIGLALGVVNFLVYQHVPQRIMEFILLHISSKYTFLLVLNCFLLVVGCMMDMFSAIIVVVPLILPAAKSFGIDPIHLGVIFLANLTIGYLTPPIGMDLFVSHVRFQEPVLKIFRASIPFFFILLVTLLIITYWPDLSLFLIDVFGKRPPLITF